ncbi:hypothetical protein DYU05_12660 [Mucilaginibacter terrenus]|uniref:Uncharacterized protein n=1 Tax=Mucilaginibacter terrenus TaxID=2482727 RepID=A0A3E2NPS2_9SPHI|nr:hypothetical protein DYU05_12660 [Mucilaginibacter terrenus]
MAGTQVPHVIARNEAISRYKGCTQACREIAALSLAMTIFYVTLFARNAERVDGEATSGRVGNLAPLGESTHPLPLSPRCGKRGAVFWLIVILCVIARNEAISRWKSRTQACSEIAALSLAMTNMFGPPVLPRHCEERSNLTMERSHASMSVIAALSLAMTNVYGTQVPHVIARNEAIS